MVVGTKSYELHRFCSPPSIIVNNYAIKYAFFKNLGVHSTSTLTWNVQVDYILKKTYSSIDSLNFSINPYQPH